MYKCNHCKFRCKDEGKMVFHLLIGHEELKDKLFDDNTSSN